MVANHGATLEFGLGESADLIRDTTVRFAADESAPLAAEIDQTNTFRASGGPRSATRLDWLERMAVQRPP